MCRSECRGMYRQHGSIPGMSGTTGRSCWFSESAVMVSLGARVGKETLMRFSARFVLLAALLPAGHFAVPPAPVQAQSPLPGSPAPVVSDQKIEATAAAPE